MKKIALASLLSLVALTTVAQTAPKSPTVTISGAKSDVTQQVHPMPAAEFNQFAGSYELANGNSLALFTRGLKKYAAIHGEARHEVVATSANSFAAKDGQLKFDIYREDDGTVHGAAYIPKDVMQTADGRTVQELVKVEFR
jgi:hypothetical protein